MEHTLEQRLATVEKSLRELTTTVLKLTPVKKDWRKSVGKLRDTPLAREVDRLGQEYRAQQNQS
ncbi:MAG TPA: hypothetical protein PKN08_12975 [Opitutaceae bacterium]|jgi:hypothetical protein|nr:hypothetical protein [Opitutaceae bacterium]